MKRFKHILVFLPEPSRDHQVLEWCGRIAECSEPEAFERVHCVARLELRAEVGLDS